MRAKYARNVDRVEVYSDHPDKPFYRYITAGEAAVLAEELQVAIEQVGTRGY